MVIFIPKYTDIVSAGHVNTGWNLGQLVYVLATLGFDVKKGKFIEYGYSLCAMVKISNDELPLLRGDRGDIEIMQEAGVFPFAIKGKSGIKDGFDSRGLKAINWDDFNGLNILYSGS